MGLVAKRVADATSLPLESPEQMLINIGQPSQRQIVERVSAYAPMGYAVAVGSAIAFALALWPPGGAGPSWPVSAPVRWSWPASGRWRRTPPARAVDGGRPAATRSRRSSRREFVAASTAGFGQWSLAACGMAGAVLLAAGLVLGSPAAPQARARPRR